MHLAGDSAQPSPQLLYVGQKDTKRLLEVYVKRSLSLNDGLQPRRRRKGRAHKWVTLVEHNKKERKHSSDISLHLRPDASDEDSGKFEPYPETFAEDDNKEKQEKKAKRCHRKSSILRRSSSCGSEGGRQRRWLRRLEKDNVAGSHLDDEQSKQSGKDNSEAAINDTEKEQLEKLKVERQEGKKGKKTSLWKSFLGWFSKGGDENPEDQEGGEERPIPKPALPSPPNDSCLPLPTPLSGGDSVTLHSTKSFKKKLFHKRTLSLKRRSTPIAQEVLGERPSNLELLSATHKSIIESCEVVEPNDSYYENMSEELKKIVREVKDSPVDENKNFTSPIQRSDIDDADMSQEEIAARIFALIKQEGDSINCKLKESPSVSSFFEGLSYGSFKQLADHYVEVEVPEERSQAARAAPELVKFAFTLDFTARVAGLSQQAVGPILGFGSQYLQDRFTHMVTESHPQLQDSRQTLNENPDEENLHSREHPAESF